VAGVRFPKFIAPIAIEGGAPAVLLGISMAAAMMAGLVVSRPAAAHTPGLSTASFDVQPDGRVEARLVFASADLLQGGPRLALRAESGADILAFVTEGVEVTADGAVCQATLHDAGLREGDGFAIDASYACPAGAGEIAATLYYLSSLGPAHREIARITAGSATSEAVLSGDRRAIALRLPVDTLRAKRLRNGRRLTMVTAAFAVFMAGLFVWRWRATRKA
jgi:hypothetical protein